MGVTKASPFGRGGGVADGEGKLCEKNPLTRYRGSSPIGRALHKSSRVFRGMGFPDALTVQMRNWRKNIAINKNLTR